MLKPLREQKGILLFQRSIKKLFPVIGGRGGAHGFVHREILLEGAAHQQPHTIFVSLADVVISGQGRASQCL